ncbi:winged helix-turn-helix domain-containing protein [Photobacterium swingsii]|uniref:winged helix-turn-helix domain-containing protein n=1 Tax=Photobacterium swingsii TaxID=680026 RepID=UPI00406784DB
MDSIRIINENNSIELCADPYQIIVDDQYKVALTIIEGKLFELLLNHNTVTRQFCIAQLWEGRVISDPDKSLTQVVSTLRKKLDKVATKQLIVTTPRVGYRISSQWQHVASTHGNQLNSCSVIEEVTQTKNRIRLPLNSIVIKVGIIFLIAFQSVFFIQYFLNDGINNSPYSIIYLNKNMEETFKASNWDDHYLNEKSSKFSISVNNYRVYLSCRNNQNRINITYSINAFIDYLQKNNNLLDSCSYDS